MTTPDAFDPAPYRDARTDLRDLLTRPVEAWQTTPAARRTDTGAAARYHDLLTVPLDLAAAGHVVTVKQTDAGWHIEITRALTDDAQLWLQSEARSYVAALFQLADMATQAIDDLERTARRDHAEAVDASGAA